MIDAVDKSAIENTEQREVMDPVAVEAATEKQAAGASRPTISNSPDSPLVGAKAGEAGSHPSSAASPAPYDPWTVKNGRRV